MYNINNLLVVWRNKRFFMALVAFLALSGVALASRTGLMASLLGKPRTGPRLTVIARADGTLDIKEFEKKDQWFAPDVVGSGLKMTAVRKFGKGVDLDNVSVLVQSDPGVNDETVRVALVSIGQSGFRRVGFTDPRVGEIARYVTESASSTRRVSAK